MKKIAVIADANSPQFFFPLWLRYYGNLFGPGNLHLLTYAGLKAEFLSFGLGQVWEVNASYNDELRARIISDMVAVLLRNYDVVVRCDIDEFLVPDPALHANLFDFIQKNSLPYVTANGIDLVELAEDGALDMQRPILASQRRFGFRASSLNKTCITTIPLRWAPGFHGASVFPSFAGIFNFHLKFADIRGRIEWHEFMQRSASPDSSEFQYFSDGSKRLIDHQNWYKNFPKHAMDAEPLQSQFNQDFIDSVEYDGNHRIYQGEFKTQTALILISPRFENIF